MSPKVAIITPVYGHTESARVALGYATARERLVAAYNSFVMPESLFFSDDLVRGRSRAASHALDTNAEYFLWWDSDVVPEDPIGSLSRMLGSGHMVIGAPYPVKRIPARIPYRVSGPDGGTKTLVASAHAIQVDDLAFGFMLTHRGAIEEMVSHYRDELWWTDIRTGHPNRECVAIFDLMFGETRIGPDGKRFRTLDSEDYSFCRRWRALGGKVHMYVGPYTPFTHVGPHAFRTNWSELGNTK